MHRFTRALGALVATAVVTGGVTVVAGPTAQARPAHPAPQRAGAPVLLGSGTVGNPLSVLIDGLATLLPVQWLRDGNPIPGATGGSYVPTTDDIGHAISALVSIPLVGDIATSAITIVGEVTPPGESAVTPASAPTVTAGSGGPKVGTSLTATAPEWNQEGVTTTYQWLRNGQPIAGATQQTYPLVAADLDQPISVRATGRKDGLTDGTVTSNAIKATIGDAPTPTTQPTISGPGTVGQALSVDPGTWGAGATPTYAYQWRRDNAAIEGATTSGYTPTVRDVGHVLTVTVTATRPGHRPGTFRTSGVSVPKLVSVLSASLSRKKIKQTQRAAMTVVLSVPGLDRPAGKLTILDGRRAVTTVALTPAKAGKVTISLRGLKPGVHRLRAAYAGSDLATEATSKVVRLTVTKAGRKPSR